MNSLDRRELEFLARNHGHLCVSIFLPAHRAGPETREDMIRLKNLANQAEARLRELGMRSVKARDILSPVRSLAQKGIFSRLQKGGLAIYVAEGLFHCIQVQVPLQEAAVVAQRFELGPVLPAFFAGSAFYVLGLSRKRVRFFVGAADELTEQPPLPGVPSSLDEALKYDVRESVLQAHTGAGVHGLSHVRGSAGKKGAVFTGQGIGVDDEKTRTLEFVLQVERGIRRALRDREGPLVLAAVEELMAAYRSVNKYPRLLDEGIPGNPDRIKPSELQAAARRIVQEYSESDREHALWRYRDLAASSKRSDDLKEILFSAYQGRVESAFVASGARKWGTFDFEEDAIDVHGEARPGDEDLLNTAAVQTILTRGTVYALPPKQVPGGREMAAIFRY